MLFKTYVIIDLMAKWPGSGIHELFQGKFLYSIKFFGLLFLHAEILDFHKYFTGELNKKSKSHKKKRNFSFLLLSLGSRIHF